MNDNELKNFLTLLMLSDPWPAGCDREVLSEVADRESAKRGYSDWVQAYHSMA